LITKPDSIALDLDNTMYEYSPCNEVAEDAVCAQVSFRLGLSKTAWSDVLVLAKLEVKENLGNTAASHSRLHYFKTALERLGLSSHLDFALQLETTYWGNFIREMRKVRGLEGFLEAARENAIPIIVMTDMTTSIQIRKLNQLGVSGYISGLVTSEEVGRDKPNLAFISYTQRNLGINEGHWWVVGDDEIKDQELSQAIPSAEFIHINPSGKKNSFFDVTKRIEQLCLPSAD
jgi:FMN phosphatase YigB (HAD superfamily)